MDAARRAEAACFLDLLQRYYARTLVRLAPDEWPQIVQYAELSFAQDHERVRHALGRIARAPQDDFEGFEYEYNRLFVGPDKPAAPPYESVYLSEEGTLMRRDTLAVRAAYRTAGMQVDAKNVEPDDHFAYELAFSSHLLRESTDEAHEALRTFHDEHLTRWVPLHAEAVRSATANEVCLGFTDLLEAMEDALAARPDADHTRQEGL